MNKTLLYILPAAICLVLAFLTITGWSQGEKAKRHTRDSLDIELYGKMLSTFNDSVKDLKEFKDAAKFDSAFHRAGNLCYDNGQYIEAFEFYTFDLDLAQRTGNKYNYYCALANIGLVYDVFREYNRAMYYYQLAYPHIHDNGWTDLEAAVLDMMFSTSCNAGKPEQAEGYLYQRKSIRTSKPIFDRYTVMKNYGQLAAAKQQYTKAIDYYQQNPAGDRQQQSAPMVRHSHPAADWIVRYRSRRVQTRHRLPAAGREVGKEMGQRELPARHLRRICRIV